MWLKTWRKDGRKRSAYFIQPKPFLSPNNRYFPLSGRRISTFSFVAKSEQHFQVGFNYTALTARPPLEKLEKRISAFLFAIVFCANSRRLCKRRRRPLCKVIEAQRPCSWLQNNILPPHPLSSSEIDVSESAGQGQSALCWPFNASENKEPNELPTALLL